MKKVNPLTHEWMHRRSSMLMLVGPTSEGSTKVVGSDKIAGSDKGDRGHQIDDQGSDEGRTSTCMQKCKASEGLQHPCIPSDFRHAPGLLPRRLEGRYHVAEDSWYSEDSRARG